MKQFKSAGRTHSPCYQCQDRAAGCHTDCERYADFQDTHLEEVRVIRKNRAEHLQTFWGIEQKKMAKDFNSNVWKQSKK